MSRVTSLTPVLLFKQKSPHPGKPSGPCRLAWLVRHQKGNQVRWGHGQVSSAGWLQARGKGGWPSGPPHLLMSHPLHFSCSGLPGFSADSCVHNLKAGHGFMISLTLVFWLVCFLASCLPPAECGPPATAAYLPPWLSPQCLSRARNTVGAL